MDEGRAATLPAGIDTMAAGAELAAALESVDASSTSAGELPVLLRAARRQLNRDTARFYAVVRETALADREAPAGRRAGLDEFSADELRATLVLSRTAAWRMTELADDLAVRVPAVNNGLWDGALDEPRARAFTDGTVLLSPEHTDRVVAALLPEAPTLTAYGLRQRIEEMAIALDPEWATKKHDAALRQRRVRARQTEAGTANLSGLDLPLDQVAHVVSRIESLAAAAKAAGHPGLLDTLRADLYLALLTDRYPAMDDAQIVESLLADARPDPAGPDPDDPMPDDPVPDHPGPGPGSSPPPGGRTSRRRGNRRARIEVRVALTTLLGLDRRPARMPGWGPIHAELARDLVAEHVRGEWRVAVARADGTLLAALLTTRRPTCYGAGPPGPGPAARGVIELHVDATTLDALDPADHPAWAAVITDLQAQLATCRGGPCGTTSGTQRFPGAELGRLIEMRDRECVFIGCGMPALRSDIDHTHAVEDGGRTLQDNLGALCRHDHRLKHEGGWHLDQPEPGWFAWTSRTGTRHTRPPRPTLAHLPDPDPLPEDRRSPWRPTEYAADGHPLWVDTPYPAASGPAPPRPPAANDEPPF